MSGFFIFYHECSGAILLLKPDVADVVEPLLTKNVICLEDISENDYAEETIKLLLDNDMLVQVSEHLTKEV